MTAICLSSCRFVAWPRQSPLAKNCWVSPTRKRSVSPKVPTPSHQPQSCHTDASAMSPSPFTVITRVPIPASLAPETVIAALQTYEALITPNPYLDRYERRAVEVDEVVNDPFFRADGQKLQAFIVYDCVPIIPGLGSWASKQVAIPCVFQSVEHGVRCCARAQAGVTVRSSYEVRRRGEVEEGPELVVGPGDGDYELVDISNVECGALVRPFVRTRLSAGHQALLQQVIDNLVSGGGQNNTTLSGGSTQ